MQKEHQPSVRWEGAAAAGGSVDGIVLLEIAWKQCSAPYQGGAPSCGCFAEGVTIMERSGFLRLLMASGDFCTILSAWFQCTLMAPIEQLRSSQASLRTLCGHRNVHCGLSQTAQHLGFWSSVLWAVRKAKSALNELCDTHSNSERRRLSGHSCTKFRRSAKFCGSFWLTGALQMWFTNINRFLYKHNTFPSSCQFITFHDTSPL